MPEQQPSALQYDGQRRYYSLILLVLANLVPLAGVLVLGWDVATLMSLYWSENLIVGFYTLLKMLDRASLAELPLCLFFCLHYGGFCAGHGLFLQSFFFDYAQFAGGALSWRQHWPLLLAFGALLISHGVSFVGNYLLGPERRQLTVRQVMMTPYSRIFILHVAIIVGGMGVQALGEPLVMLLALIALKIAVDVRLHLREHGAAAGAAD